MESELLRLATYSSFSMTDSRLYPSRLSRLGFHYDESTSCVVCHRCQFNVDLQSLDDERDLHRRHHRQSTICRDAPPETRDVIASRDLPTEQVDALPPRTQSPGATDFSEFLT